MLESDDKDDREQALALKDSWLSGACQVLVPTLWVFEVGNILGIKRPASARQLLQAMTDLELEARAPQSYFEVIYRLMGRHKVTFYDASYHGLAIHTGGTFLTADAAYAKKTSPAGHVVPTTGLAYPEGSPFVTRINLVHDVYRLAGLERRDVVRRDFR